MRKLLRSLPARWRPKVTAIEEAKDLNTLSVEDLVSSHTQIQSEKGMKILKIRSDHGGEFENDPFETFCEKHGIIHEFSSPRTPQQNGVVERKNRTLQEMARTMIHENNLAKHF